MALSELQAAEPLSASQDLSCGPTQADAPMPCCGVSDSQTFQTSPWLARDPEASEARALDDV